MYVYRLAILCIWTTFLFWEKQLQSQLEVRFAGPILAKQNVLHGVQRSQGRLLTVALEALDNNVLYIHCADRSKREHKYYHSAMGPTMLELTEGTYFSKVKLITKTKIFLSICQFVNCVGNQEASLKIAVQSDH